MHPVSTALFVLGYALALPIASKLPALIAAGHRLAFWGHQLGIVIASLGWVARGQIPVVVGHVAWLVIVHIWFRLGSRRSRSTATGSASPG